MRDQVEMARDRRAEEAPGPPRADAAAAAQAASDRLNPLFWRIMPVVLLGPLMSQLDSTVVNVALPAMRQDLHASIGAVQWVVSGYLTALALVLPLNAWLVDRLGAKRLYIACFSGFTLASLACGATRSIEGLICARVLQGVCGGLLAPMAQMMTARAAGRHLSRVIGYTAVPILFAPILGPTLAGVVLKAAGWPWLFYINLPLGILAVALAVWRLPHDADAGRRRPFDLAGFLLISPALAALLFGLDHAPHAAGLAALGGGLALAGLFIRHALRRKETALVDVRLFGEPVFATAAVTQFLNNGAAFAGQMLLPLFLIGACGYSPAAAGWMLAMQGLGLLCVYPATGFLIARLGCRAVSAGGALLVAASTLPVLWMTQGAFSPVVMAAILFGRGLGQGAIGVPSISAAYAAVPREKIPLATTAANIVQRIGGPTATTVVALVLAWASGRVGGLRPHAFTAPFLALVAVQLLTAAAASRLPAELPHERGAGR
jgi:EmrB/QacA subfamily drug resistance transporter